MRFYRVSVSESESNGRFFTSKVQAHDHARQILSLDTIYVDLVEVQTDHASLAGILSGDLFSYTRVVESWTLTKRGGLRPVLL